MVFREKIWPSKHLVLTPDPNSFIFTRGRFTFTLGSVQFFACLVPAIHQIDPRNGNEDNEILSSQQRRSYNITITKLMLSIGDQTGHWFEISISIVDRHANTSDPRSSENILRIRIYVMSLNQTKLNNEAHIEEKKKNRMMLLETYTRTVWMCVAMLCGWVGDVCVCMTCGMRVRLGAPAEQEMLLNRHARKSFCRWNVESATARAALKSCDQSLDSTKARNDAYSARLTRDPLPFVSLLIESRSTFVGCERDTILARYYFRPFYIHVPVRGSRSLSRGPLLPPDFHPRSLRPPTRIIDGIVKLEGIREFWITWLGASSAAANDTSSFMFWLLLFIQDSFSLLSFHDEWCFWLENVFIGSRLSRYSWIKILGNLLISICVWYGFSRYWKVIRFILYSFVMFEKEVSEGFWSSQVNIEWDALAVWTIQGTIYFAESVVITSAVSCPNRIFIWKEM